MEKEQLIEEKENNNNPFASNPKPGQNSLFGAAPGPITNPFAAGSLFGPSLNFAKPSNRPPIPTNEETI